MFRDTFAVEMLLAGVPIEQVAMLLGHKSIKTTEKAIPLGTRATEAIGRER
jgi:site-specific recombinase XerD